MKKMPVFLFVFLISAMLFAVPVYDRLIFSTVDSSDLGNVAPYNENLSSSTDCRNPVPIRGEKLLKSESRNANSFDAIILGNFTKFYYRTHVNQVLRNGTNITYGVVYAKPQDANCYYWMRASPDEPSGNVFSVGYSPQGRTFGRIDFAHGYPSQNKTTVSVREFGAVNGIIKSGFEFEVAGRSNRANLALQARDGDNTDRVYYWEVQEGGDYGRNRLFDAPVSSYRGSRFLSLVSEEAVFDMFLYNSQRVRDTGSLYIRSAPSGASIYLGDDRLRGRTPLTINGLNPREEIVTLTLPGYQTYEGEALIIANATVNISVALNRTANGTLNVSTIPSGAWVYVDNQEMGQTPFKGSIRAGNHQLRVTKASYRDYAQAFSIQENRTTTINLTLNRTPIQRTGILHVGESLSTARYSARLADVSAAGIHPAIIDILDNNGQELAQVSINPGSFYNQGYNFQVVVYRTGDWFALSKWAEIGIMEIQGQNLSNGTLNVSSTPSGARVYVDNQDRGLTPFRQSIVEGNHPLRLTKAGYQTYNADFLIRPNQITTINATLNQSGNRSPARQAVQPGGSIYIRSTPSASSVYLNGEYKGRTPLTIKSLDAGEYKLKVTRPNYADEEATIRISAEEKKSLTVSLQKAQAVKTAITELPAQPMATVPELPATSPAETAPSTASQPEGTAPTPATSTSASTATTSRTSTSKSTSSLVTSSFTSSDEMDINLRCMILGC